MRKFLKFDDGELVELSPINYKEFMAIDLWYGGSDLAYNAWLHKNGYKDPLDYREEALETATFIVTLEPIDPNRFLFSVEEDVWIPYTPTYHNFAYYLRPQE